MNGGDGGTAASTATATATVPNIVHLVFGLRPQVEPFHLLHYLCVESCRRRLRPERIFLHYRHLPWGVYWDLARPHLELHEVDLVPEVSAVPASASVPDEYRYAHHADFVRLDALIEHGGIYADIDTLFLAAPPASLFQASFAIGREPPVRDEVTGETRPSLCNALMLAAPGSPFAVAWRAQMAEHMNGTWSNHSGFLAQRLCDAMPAEVVVVPQSEFLPYPPSRDGLAALFERDEPAPAASSIHLWEHLWRSPARRDFSDVHAGTFTEGYIRSTDTTFNRLARDLLPDLELELELDISRAPR
ncbi:MAG: glycosyl transferase [Acidimicrobiia bacterium]|nr:glycosyl transferase [Acidimicrobiia bacterium]